MDSQPTDPARDPDATLDQPVADPDETVIGGSPEKSAEQDTTVAFAARPPDASSAAARQIGRYDILNEIARGGMGVVCRAFDRQLDRLVALKLIKSGELADADEIERFQTEAKAAAQLDHPGIVAVYEVGQVGSQHFMAMAYIDGHSLWQEVKESPLAPKRAAKLMQQVAEAVQYAHDRGIVHRDLKPQNILLAKDGQPKVTDFGLAKRQESDSNLTETGQALGTPSYMPPEQAQGNVKQVGPLSDVYSLGATLYCLLTGRPPFQAATQLETMLQVVDQEPVSPKSLNRAVSVDLETICLRCLEKEPAKRYATAAALAQDLNRYLTGEPIQARRVGRLERVLKWVARKPMTAAAYGLSALTALLLIIGVTISTFWRNAEVARGEAEGARSEAITAKIEADSARNEAVQAREKTEVALDGEKTARAGEERARKELEQTKSYNQYLLNVRLSPTLWDNGWVANARKALEDCPPHLRQWEWHYLNRKMHPELATMPGHKASIRALKLSPDGRLLATCREAVRIWDASTGRQLDVVDEIATVRVLAFSPDVRHLAIGTDPTMAGGAGDVRSAVLVWDLINHRRIALFEQPARVISVAYRPDGKRLAAGLGDGTMRLWNVADYSEVPMDAKHSNGAAHLNFLPVGKRLISGCWNGDIKLWDSETGHLIKTVNAAPQHQLSSKSKLGLNNLVGLRSSPDGRELLSAVRGGTVKRWNAESLQELASFQEDHELESFSISPDLQRTATWLLRVLIRDGTSGKRLLDLQGSRGTAVSVSFSPDQQRVATGWSDGYIRIWDIVDGKLLSTLTGHVSGVNLLEFSQDGSRLYSCDFAGAVLAWDLADPPDVVEFTEPSENPVTAIDADGRLGAFVVQATKIRVRDLALNVDVAEWSEVPQEILQIAFSPNGRWLASAGTDGTVRLRNLENLAESVTLAKHVGRVNSLEFSLDGELLASAGNDRSAKIWDLTQQRERTTLQGHAHNVMKVIFNRRGNRLATYSQDGTVKLWNAEDGRELLKFTWGYAASHNHFWVLQFSPDGSQLASTHGSHLRIWDSTSGSEIARLEGKGKVLSIEFSPDGRLLASCGYFPNIHVWDISNQREVAQCPGENTVLRFNFDGSRLVSASVDQTIRMWDTATWQEIATLTGHKYVVSSLQFDSKGKNLLSASHDGTIRRWMTEESPHEREERLYNRPRIWRLRELRLAEDSSNWYAAAFHLGWLLKDQPNDDALKTRYENTLAKLKAQNITPPKLPKATTVP